MAGHTYNHLTDIVPSIQTQSRSSELIERHIGICLFSFPYIEEGIHGTVSDVCLKSGLSTNPVCALFGNGSLCKLVTEPYFKIRTEKISLPIQLRDIELSLLLLCFISRKCGRCEDEIYTLDLLQLFFQRLIGINRKAGCRDRDLGIARRQYLSQIIDDTLCYIIELLRSPHICLRSYLSNPGLQHLTKRQSWSKSANRAVKCLYTILRQLQDLFPTVRPTICWSVFSLPERL